MPDKTILRFHTKQSRATRHPSQLNGKNYRVRHIFCRRTPPPPKLNRPLIDFGVINILWISARSPSREQWYHGLNELEVTFLKILQLLWKLANGWQAASPRHVNIFNTCYILMSKSLAISWENLTKILTRMASEVFNNAEMPYKRRKSPCLTENIAWLSWQKLFQLL